MEIEYRFYFNTKMKQEFTITKKVAKQGNNSIIILPKVLQNKIKPSNLVELKIKILDGEN